jgi:nucleoside-diphosphate-sugar epimerase
VRTLHNDFGRDTLAVRLGFLYGPSERRSNTRPRVSLVASLVEDALTTGKITVAAVSPSTDWTFVPDIGRSLVALLQAPHLNNTLYHLTSGEALSQMDIAHAIQRVIPNVEIETHDQRPGFRGVLVGERLQADTGFNDWTTFADGLAETIAWFQHQLEQTR